MIVSTRERLADAAARRFYRDGFRNVGIDQILGDVGISKTAFYKHFESKDDLMLAALEMKNRWLQDAFRAAIRDRGGPTAIGRLRVLLDVVDEVVSSSEYQGCIFVNASIEFPLLHEPAHIAAAQHKQAIEDIVYELATSAGADDPRVLARELCLVMEGAYITRQITGDPNTIDIARRVADLVIASHLPKLDRADKVDAQLLTSGSDVPVTIISPGQDQ
jgi:AcrR family transcriptional regulator